MFRASDGAGRIHLDAAEAFHDLEDRTRARRREELCRDREAPRPLDGDLYGPGPHGWTVSESVRMCSAA
jgi:hypothetical protein